MEKITIARIGAEKVINYTNKKTGQPDSFKKIGVQTNEYGERWHDITYRGEVPVKVGQSYDVEIKTNEYNGKTYYNAELPKKSPAANNDAILARLMQLQRDMTAVRQMLVMQFGGKSSLEGVVDYPPNDGPMPFAEDGNDVKNPTTVSVLNRQPEPPEFTDEDFPKF